MKKHFLSIVALVAFTAAGCASLQPPVLLPSLDVPAGVDQVATDLKDPATGDQLVVVQAKDVPASVKDDAFNLFDPPEQTVTASQGVSQVLTAVGGSLGATGPWGAVLGTVLTGLGAAYLHPKSRKAINSGITNLGDHVASTVVNVVKTPFVPFTSKPGPGGPAGSPSDAGPGTSV